MITIGVDAHKRLHVAIAIDDAGQEVSRWSGPNSRAGWESFASWLELQNGERQIGVEGAWGYGRGLAQRLLASGEIVYEVNSRWTAQTRRRARRNGKTDELDARAIALFVRQEAPDLPRVQLEDETAVLNLLVAERENLQGESVRLQNQIHALLTQLDPEYGTTLRRIKSKANLEVLKAYEAESAGEADAERAAAVRRLAARLELVLVQLEDISERVRQKAVRFAPLTTICGVSLLTAGMLVGIIGPRGGFATDAQFAAFAGVAPLEASSAGGVRHRLNRGGNRRLNAVLYRIALTQTRYSPSAKEYLARRVSEGKTKREAIRALKRYIARAIWRLWKECADPGETLLVQP